MKPTIISVILLVIITLISGCGVKSNENQNISARGYPYTLSIVKSGVNRTSASAVAKNHATIGELLNNADVEYNSEVRNGKQTITKLDGVIATAAKGWNIYVNNYKIEFNSLADIQVVPHDLIEFRYEKK